MGTVVSERNSAGRVVIVRGEVQLHGSKGLGNSPEVGLVVVEVVGVGVLKAFAIFRVVLLWVVDDGREALGVYSNKLLGCWLLIFDTWLGIMVRPAIVVGVCSPIWGAQVVLLLCFF